MLLYAATLRIIDPAKAQAEWWISEWEDQYQLKHPSYDGTIQMSIEQLPTSEQHISAANLMGHVLEQSGNGFIVKDIKFFDEALDTAFNQGVRYSLRSQVSNRVKGELNV